MIMEHSTDVISYFVDIFYEVIPDIDDNNMQAKTAIVVAYVRLPILCI